MSTKNKTISLRIDEKTEVKLNNIMFKLKQYTSIRNASITYIITNLINFLDKCDLSDEDTLNYLFNCDWFNHFSILNEEGKKKYFKNCLRVMLPAGCNTDQECITNTCKDLVNKKLEK